MRSFSRSSTLWLAVFFIIIVSMHGALAQECPPNSHVDRIEQNGTLQTVHCKCNDDYENRGGACVRAGVGAAGSGLPIGVAGSVAGDVYIATTDGRTVVVTSGMTLRLNDAIETGPTGRIQILLKDETTFTIGPKSSMILDSFVYDPTSGPGKITARILKGIFRFVTGKIARRRPNDIQIHGPVGCFCIRGTDFEAEVKPDESGYLKVFSGEVVLKNKKTGIDSTVSRGQMISFDAAGTIKGPHFF